MKGGWFDFTIVHCCPAWKESTWWHTYKVTPKRISLYGKATLVQIVTLSSLNPLLLLGTKTLEIGYLLALAFLGAKMIETIAQMQWIFGACLLGLCLRVALISRIYKKGLLLSSQSHQNHTSREIINHMSVDIQRIIYFICYFNKIWMLLVQIFLAIYILHTNLSLGSFATLAATLIVMGWNIPLTRVQKRYQSKIMGTKDNRMKSTSEFLRNMKTLKLKA